MPKLKTFEHLRVLTLSISALSAVLTDDRYVACISQMIELAESSRKDDIGASFTNDIITRVVYLAVLPCTRLPSIRRSAQVSKLVRGTSRINCSVLALSAWHQRVVLLVRTCFSAYGVLLGLFWWDDNVAVALNSDAQTMPVRS